VHEFHDQFPTIRGADDCQLGRPAGPPRGRTFVSGRRPGYRVARGLAAVPP